ncbi:MAG TPA: RsmE family RNA methyltransferase [Candidatus Binataceae bacterium]|nr:RsmE family RNA methyltransferase [Candidatus Binataceae bacterium]
MKTPPRFAIDSQPGADATARVTGPEAHHMRDVMRIAPGETVTLIDANGSEYAAQLVRYDRAAAELRVLAMRPAPPRARLIVAQAIIKGPRMAFVVEKAAELGATELWPLTCARGLVRTSAPARHTRWNRLALAAAKQSLLAPPMQVREELTFGELIRDATRGALADALRLVCSAGAEAMAALLERERPRAILIAIGPEGDFTPDEIAAALSAGFIAAGLGPARLRSETAAIAALAIASQWLARAV